MKLLFVLQLLLISLCIVNPAKAQSSRTAGDLHGTVQDITGGSVSGAAIFLQNTNTKYQRIQNNEGDGSFRIRELPTGEYRLTVNAVGFQQYDAKITISLGEVSQVTVRLAPASVAQQLTISAVPEGIDVTQTSVATTIDPERIEEAPVRSRNYLSFVLLAPGVSAANPASPSSGLSLPESGFSFGGLRPRSNAVYIDGVDNNDEFTGDSRTELSLETVREFQVVNQGLMAEAGGAAGGSINVVMKTGANITHGDAFIFAENGSLDARPALKANGKPDLSRYRVGLALGGALKTNRSFYYTAFEQEHARGQAASEIAPDAISKLNPLLAGSGINGVSSLSTGFFPISRAETEASAKIDHQLTPNSLLSLRYSFTNNREVNDAFNTRDLLDFSTRGSTFTEDQAVAGGLTSVFGSSRVNDFRFQFAARRVGLRTSDQSGVGVLIPGVVEFGHPYAGNSQHHENHSEISDSLSQSHGRHLWKAGLTINRIHLRASVLDGFGGFYVFPDVDSFSRGTPGYFQQAFGNPDTNFAVNRFAGFLQDHWMLSSKLTLDLGARFDYEQLPTPFDQDTNNVSPRFGLAFSPSRNWVIRTGFGMFFDRYPLAFINQAMQKNGPHGFEQVVDQFRTPVSFPLTTSAIPLSEVAPSIFQPQPGMANPYSEISTLAVEHAFTSNLSATATYTFVRGVKMPRTTNTNLPPPSMLTPQNSAELGVFSPEPQQISRLVFSSARLDPRYDAIYQLQDESSSSYNGLTIEVNRRLANEFEVLASYTISKTIDDASDFVESPQNPYNFPAERAISANNQAQRFVVSALFDLPIGDEDSETNNGAPSSLWVKILSNIEMAPIFTVGSGRPVNPITGLDSARTHTMPLTSRPLDFARNSLVTPTTAVLDLRILKFFKVGEHGKLDIVAESFNLLNRTNVSQLNAWFGTQLNPAPSFGKPAEALNRRQLQFSLDFEF
jgi:hypothetical protein